MVSTISINIKNVENVRKYLTRITKRLPRESNNLTFALSKFASAQAKQNAPKVSGTLANSIRPQKVKDGWKTIVENPGGRYARDMELGFNKPRAIHKSWVSFAGYTVEDWMKQKNFSVIPEWLWVGRGKGVPRTGYRYMEKAFFSTVRATPLQIRKTMEKVLK